MAITGLEGTEADRKEILRLHNQWMRANVHLDIAAATGVFVGGSGFHGFNLNGHTYGKHDEWMKLWDFLHGVMDIVDLREETDLRLSIDRDMAFLTFEATIALENASAAASGMSLPATAVPMRFRGTEIFIRRDENGARNWKMWHCHYSPHAPAGEPRPGFGD